MDCLFLGISFGLLYLILKKFAWGPILGAVNEREQSIKDALEAADKAKEEMEILKADNEKILKEARAEKEALLKEAREMKNTGTTNPLNSRLLIVSEGYSRAISP